MSHNQTIAVNAENAGMRLDKALSEAIPDLSRSQLQRLIKDGAVSIPGETPKASLRLEEGWTVSVTLPEPQPSELVPEAIPLDVLYEDEHLLAVNKPAGMVTHPAPGHSSGTLVHAVLAHCEDLSGIGGVERPGILHRLDKGTSGVILIAKHDRSHKALAEQFARRTVAKRYRAFVHGQVTEATVRCDEPLGRDPHNRVRIAINGIGSREAHTTFHTLGVGKELSELVARPTTGRTHQIRVHALQVGHPVIADELYLYHRAKLTSKAKRDLSANHPGHLLHAWRLAFDHPESGERVALEAPLPEVFEKIRRLCPSWQEVATAEEAATC